MPRRIPTNTVLSGLGFFFAYLIHSGLAGRSLQWAEFGWVLLAVLALSGLLFWLSAWDHKRTRIIRIVFDAAVVLIVALSYQKLLYPFLFYGVFQVDDLWVLYILMTLSMLLLRDMVLGEFGVLRNLGDAIGRFKSSSWIKGLASSATFWVLLLMMVLTWQMRTQSVRRGYQGWAEGVVEKVRMTIGDGMGYQAEVAFPGVPFEDPVWVTGDPERASTLYVVERAGRILRLDDPDSEPLLTLDFTAQVGLLAGEDGATAFAFHPDFAAHTDSSFLYVYYTSAQDSMKLEAAADTVGYTQYNRLSRFTFDKASRTAKPASELVLIDQVDRHPWHNGGGLAFGPDGFLYLGLGDEGGPNEDFKNAQRTNRNFFSGILRIDVDQRGGDISHPIQRQPADGVTQGYFIPNDNPFVGQGNVLEEFFAIGLRNPYRIAFDPYSGQLWEGDVGRSSFEEINLIRSGGNYQWSYREGPDPTDFSYLQGKPPTPLVGEEVPPLFYYAHSGARRCVIGGTVYTGQRHPELHGRYIWADYVSGEVFVLDVERDADQHITGGAEMTPIASGIRSITSVNQVGDDLYLTVIGTRGTGGGGLFRLVTADAAGPAAPAVQSAAANYEALCARCHGSDGIPPPNTGLAVAPRNFQDPAWQAGVTDAHLAAVIRDGGTPNGLSALMPPWAGALSTAEINDLVGLIRGLEQQQP